MIICILYKVLVEKQNDVPNIQGRHLILPGLGMLVLLGAQMMAFRQIHTLFFSKDANSYNNYSATAASFIWSGVSFPTNIKDASESRSLSALSANNNHHRQYPLPDKEGRSLVLRHTAPPPPTTTKLRASVASNNRSISSSSNSSSVPSSLNSTAHDNIASNATPTSKSPFSSLRPPPLTTTTKQSPLLSDLWSLPLDTQSMAQILRQWTSFWKPRNGNDNVAAAAIADRNNQLRATTDPRLAAHPSAE
mmetsp:Transcript_22988/g.50103  ORF Transcript_22988/g.50103 Transcript_22988/m.50103 type:complete len:249 (+) Transcript_22988:388-1134(+)|eukprot:CAMPEP_0168742478 /NCGR_PEP_ID=MMETSP0724-20121128/13056_1 /TAXON_ID=265536 /ORGANISM="Amphiprora sp., Strain CCMP467" /LENGTH=248 /DNA_ID=CAMNT_0008790027 /DNA_START=978 /DNA_END=1724 /DNA_ORIENTATION=+